MGSVQNPAIPMDAPLVVIDDDIQYKPEVPVVALSYFLENPDCVYQFCFDGGILGYSGFVVRKRLCVDMLANWPVSCRRIDDDLLDLYFEKLNVEVVHIGFGPENSRCWHCSFNINVHNEDTPQWKSALKYDHRPPMVNKCRADFASQDAWLNGVEPPKTWIDQNARKVAFVMWYDDAISHYADYAALINRHISKQLGHGYDVIVSNKDRLRGVVRTPNTVDGTNQLVGPCMQRFPLLLDTINTGQYDYVVYVDADAIFSPAKFIFDRQEKEKKAKKETTAAQGHGEAAQAAKEDDDQFRKFLYYYRDFDFLFSKDCKGADKWGSGICAGIIVVNARSDYAKKLLEWLSFRTGPQGEEALVKSLKRGDQYFPDSRKPNGNDQGLVRHLYYDNIFGFRNKAHIVPYGYLQTFSTDPQKDGNCIFWHLAGRSNDTREEFFREVAAKILASS